MEQLSLQASEAESQLQASLEKNDHYESVFDTITAQLQNLVDFQSDMIEQYGEEKRLTTHILETIAQERSRYTGGKRAKRRAVSDEGPYNWRPSRPISQSSAMATYNSAPALKEVMKESEEESDFLLQQGSEHQQQANGRVVSTELPQITSRRRPLVSPVSPPPESSISEIFLGGLSEDDTTEIQGIPNGPPASPPDRSGRGDGTRRRPSSAKESGSTKERSTPGAKPGSVYAQSVIPKKTK